MIYPKPPPPLCFDERLSPGQFGVNVVYALGSIPKSIAEH